MPQAAPRARGVPSLLLMIAPLVVVPLAGVRAFRIAGLYQATGLILCAAMAWAAWRAAPPALDAGSSPARVAGGRMLVVPFALIGLLWVGLGTPWEATPVENGMRYAVLLSASVAVTCGFALLAEPLVTRAPATVLAGRTINLLAGAAYVVWTAFQLGAYSTLASSGAVPDSVVAIGNVLDALLFGACALTYLLSLLFASAMYRAGWLGRSAAGAYVTLSVIALVFLAIRGLSFPDPSSAGRWYLQPGFVAGIPAIPWLMPYWLGVVAVRASEGGALEPVSGAGAAAGAR